MTGVVGWELRGPPPGVGDRPRESVSASPSPFGGVAGGEGMFVPAVREKLREGSVSGAKGLDFDGCAESDPVDGVVFAGMAELWAGEVREIMCW